MNNHAVLGEVKERISTFFKNISYLQVLLIACGFVIIYVLPIILVHNYYVDDMTRTVTGAFYNRDGRFFASLVMMILSLQKTAYSLFPYLTTISAVLLTIVGFLLSVALGVKQKTALLIGSLLLPTCPFVLQMLWYRFDVLIMSLAILFVVLPFLFYAHKRRFVIGSVICLYIVFGLYQPAAFSYGIVLCIFLIKDLWHNRGKRAFWNIVIATGSFVGAFFVYRITLKLLHITISSPTRSQFISGQPHARELFLDRLQQCAKLFSDLLHSANYQYILLFVLVASGFGALLFLYKNRTQKHFLGKIVLTGIFIGCIGVLTIGINAFVLGYKIESEPWFGRYLVGYAFTMYGLFLLTTQTHKKYWIGVGVFIPVLYFSFLLSSQTSLFIKNQDDFENYIIATITPELEKRRGVKLIIDGEIPHAFRNTTVNQETFPFIHRIAMTEYRAHWINWKLNKFGNISSGAFSSDKDFILQSKEQMPVILDTTYFILRTQNDYAVISFK